jgi:hypothetical protein
MGHHPSSILGYGPQAPQGLSRFPPSEEAVQILIGTPKSFGRKYSAKVPTFWRRWSKTCALTLQPTWRADSQGSAAGWTVRDWQDSAGPLRSDCGLQINQISTLAVPTADVLRCNCSGNWLHKSSQCPWGARTRRAPGHLNLETLSACLRITHGHCLPLERPSAHPCT